MKDIWIDLTDIEQWSGHHGGTQRVVYGIAKEYFLSGKTNVHFFSYSPSRDIFYETSLTPIFNRVEQQSKTAELTSQGSVVFAKQKVKFLLLHYSPAFLRNNPKIKRRVKFVGKKGIAIVRQARGSVNRVVNQVKGITRQRGTGNEIIFGNNDIVLILGKPWDNPGLQNLLFKQKQNGAKVVQVVYDLIISLYPHLHHPSLFGSYTRHMFGAVQISDLMLPISRSTNKDLKKFAKLLELPKPQTSIIRLGDDLGTVDTGMSSPSDKVLPGEFILCVGTIENRKNHTLLYQAYKLAAEQGIDLPKLVIVGGIGWLTGDIVYLIQHDLEIRDKILILNNVNDAGLSWLYQNCLLTVYPSLYEGWGLPVAESMAYGKVCLASNISSIPEIAGDLTEYFSPYNAEECLKLFRKYVLNKALLVKAEAEIKEKYKTTSWKRTYEQVDAQINKL